MKHQSPRIPVGNGGDIGSSEGKEMICITFRFFLIKMVQKKRYSVKALFRILNFDFFLCY